MDLTEPMRSVIPSVAGSVLAALARTRESLSGRALAGRVKPKASHRGVQEVLRKLVEGGVVHRVDKGGAALYSLNRDHLAAPAIVQLARLRDELVERMEDHIGSWTVRPVTCVMFGSAARGDGTPESDIDLLVVRPDDVAREDDVWREQLVALGVLVWKWTGNPLRLVEVGDNELRAQASAGERYLAEVARDGITLAGTPLARTIARAP